MILTIKEITELAKFAGIELDASATPGMDDLETEICIDVDQDDKPYAYLYDYPDEGVHFLS
jgi:hypothetical protein